MEEGRGKDKSIMKPAITPHLVGVFYPKLWYPHPPIYMPLDASIPVRWNWKGQWFKGTRSALLKYIWSHR